jgi:hypothetical protein
MNVLSTLSNSLVPKIILIFLNLDKTSQNLTPVTSLIRNLLIKLPSS